MEATVDIYLTICMQRNTSLLSCRMVELILARTDWVQMARTTSDEPAPNICSAIKDASFSFPPLTCLFSNADKV